MINLKEVENQTPELCLAAVKQDWRELKFVKNQKNALHFVDGMVRVIL